MTSVEISGKSLEEAKQLAAQRLNAPAEELSITVLEESKGLFGKSSVKIKAEFAGEASPVVQSAPAEAVVAKEEPAVVAAIEVEAPAEEAKPAKKAAAAKAPRSSEKREKKPEAEGDEGPEVVATEQDGKQLLDLVESVIASAELDVQCKISGISGKYVNIEIDGRDVAHLVGKHGEVLNALQYLVNIIGGRRFANGVRATIDGNNYRHRREEALTRHALKLAEEVKGRQEEAVLSAFPAFERRIVHKALADFGGVTT